MTDILTTYYVYPTPYGPISIAASAKAVLRIALGDCRLAGLRIPNEWSNLAATELLEYFAGKRRTFTFPLDLAGTPFQRAVWEGLARVPYGETVTATELAAAIGRAGTQRSVGLALRSCPAPIAVPTHRVVTAQGKPWGAGPAAQVRGALLRMERRALAEGKQEA